MVALRAAYHHGIEVVEALLGMKDPVEDSNAVEPGRALAARILSAANFVAKIGGTHQDLPTLANARQLLSSVGGGKWKHSNQPGMDDDDRRGLGGMSLGRSLSETFMEISRPDVERQIALQNSACSGNGKSSPETTSN